MIFFKNGGWEIVDLEIPQAIETGLNIIKIKDKEIERNGEIYFTDSWYSSLEDFEFGNEAHKIAKDIFMQQLQTDIKTKIGELKLLEEVFKSINLQECIGTVIPDSSKILTEAKKDIEAEVTKQIEESIKPIARKKKKKAEEERR